MNYSQRGFGLPVLLVVLAVLFVSGGAYWYVQKAKAPSTAPRVSIENGLWYKDSQHVYDEHGTILPGVNPATFKAISSSYFATDGVHIWNEHETYDGAAIRPLADPATFTIVTQTNKTGDFPPEFEKDKSHVWYMGTLIPHADPNTFVVTGDYAAKDAKHTYRLTNDGLKVQ